MSDDEQFDDFMAAADAAMYIVTTRSLAGSHIGERAGCLMGFAAQVSIHPLRFLACISKTNHTHKVALEAEHLAVHLVPESSMALARLFGEQTGDDVDKFAHGAWHDAEHGVPVLDDCPHWFVGRIIQRVDLGDHTGHLLDVVEASPAPPPTRILRLSDVEHLTPGHPA